MMGTHRCQLCGGDVDKGTTTFTVDYGAGLIVLRNVPAQVCTLCGESWIDDHTAAKLEKIVQEAKDKHCQLEIIDIAA